MKHILPLLFAIAAGLMGCAPPGYRYEVGSLRPTPSNICAKLSADGGTVNALNERVGKPDGPSSPVVSVDALAPAETGNGWECRGTVTLVSGREGGILSARTDQLAWVSDKDIEIRKRLTAEARRDIERGLAEQKAAEQTKLTAKTPIEPKAILFKDTDEFREAVYSAARMVRSHDFKCETISAARPMVLARGFVLTCNNFAYTYNLQDKGGQWSVTIN